MFCENCGAEIQDPNQSFCLSCGVPLRVKIFEFSERTNEFKEGKFKTHLYETLESNCIKLFIDSKHDRVWVWYGSNTTTRMKFIAAKLIPTLRDHYGMGFKIVAIDEGSEPSEFKIMIGLEKQPDIILPRSFLNDLRLEKN